ncbi:hypothetical protein LGZ99_24035 [Photorhabdus temperata]|uniref:Uncharacterized protein n=1 Tax=Photorhabdus temperata subsp. temperata Meg1 TaxID=1393735 RepID=A0A081RSB0_PHOTE|nr:hypothetical protein [Photorhabdus temperata]KER01563.1 hypothetical protein MEG1DRAFT_03854 [Photorhabdus temperata subsp. temperata Meg1]MCT8350179.1 hypothetical protein [Photorhabdus temperata]
MTQDEQTILMFKGVIASLPEQQQENVSICKKVIRKMLADYPNGEAHLAIGLFCAELQHESVPLLT